MDSRIMTGEDIKDLFMEMIDDHINNEKELFLFIASNYANINICSIPEVLLVNISKGANAISIYFRNDDLWLTFDDHEFCYVLG